jgi:hypothetical protein
MTIFADAKSVEPVCEGCGLGGPPRADGWPRGWAQRGRSRINFVRTGNHSTLAWWCPTCRKRLTYDNPTVSECRHRYLEELTA